MSPLILSLLGKRGITSESEIKAFLEPNYELHTHDPFLLQGMERAVTRLLRAVEKGERVAIYADFDCDGIPGAVVLSDFFKKIRHANFEVYLPHRDREGYGFHTEAIADLASRDARLIITVDVGSNAVAAVGYAKQLGIDCIVTDHHELTGARPDATAVLNPKLPSTSSGQAAYPFAHLCGAAVAFKLVQAALHEGKRRDIASFKKIPAGWEKWLLDMVALATIADMVPLVGENRVLAHFGLKVLRRSPRFGIEALCRRLRLRKRDLTEDDIGFSIAPRINAASRMDDPDLSFRLLATDDAAEAEHLAAVLEKLNASRKGIVAGVVREARRHVGARFSPDERVVVLGDPEWKPALLGLAANSIMAERGGLVCLWGRDTQGRIKGSCRSDGSVSIAELFSTAGAVFEEAGGHAASGGFTVSSERVHTLSKDLSRIAATLTSASSRTKRDADAYDAHLSLPDISPDLFGEVSKLSPFGIGNPKPIFLFGGAFVTGVQRFGREKNHVEIMLECRRSGKVARAFEFFKSPDDFSFVPARGASASVLATLERDTFRGGFALRIVDIVSSAPHG